MSKVTNTDHMRSLASAAKMFTSSLVGQLAETSAAAIEELEQSIPKEYTLPVATAETLGGVSPVKKLGTMKQDVGVDENGKLYTKLPFTPTSLSSKDDLDTFSSTDENFGLYIASDSTANKIPNSPLKSKFTMLNAASSARGFQLIVGESDTSPVYIRARTGSGTWSAWREI